PKAEFAAFQSGLEVRDEYIEQVFLALVKHEEMCAPRHIAHHANSGLSQLRTHGLRRHGNYLSYRAGLRSTGKGSWNTALGEADMRDKFVHHETRLWNA